jgi:hypothetical protein
MSDQDEANNRKRRRKARVATQSKVPDKAPVKAEYAPYKYSADQYTNVIGSGLRNLCVYACHQEIAMMEKDPSIEDKSIKYPYGNDVKAKLLGKELVRGKDRIGQAGWDIGLNFKDLSDLEKNIRECGVPEQLGGGNIQHGEIARLAISAHGALEGIWFPNGKGSFPEEDRGAKSGVRALFYAPVAAVNKTVILQRSAYPHPEPKNEEERKRLEEKMTFKTQPVHDPGIEEWLYKIGLFTREGSTIILMGCCSGAGQDGTDLLKALSDIWPKRKIVAFSTIGIVDANWMLKPPSFLRICNPVEYSAGMKDTLCSTEIDIRVERQKLKETFQDLEWASEESLNAKILINLPITEGGKYVNRYHLLRCSKINCCKTKQCPVDGNPEASDMNAPSSDTLATPSVGSAQEHSDEKSSIGPGFRPQRGKKLRGIHRPRKRNPLEFR